MKTLFSALIIAVLLPQAALNQVFDWVNSIGSTGNDYGNTICTDSTGNVYVAGFISATASFESEQNQVTLPSEGMKDVFVVKYTPEGNIIWAKTFGGPEDDEANSIDVDSDGNVYVSGFYSNSVDFDPNQGTYLQQSFGNTDAFILKLNSSGDFDWVITLGGASLDNAQSLAVDNNGNIMATGNYRYDAQIVNSSDTTAFNAILNADIFLLNISPEGDINWSESIDGGGFPESESISIDDSGNIYLTGNFIGTNADFDPSENTHSLYAEGQTDIFILKLTDSGEFIWAKRIGGILFDQVSSITNDINGNALLTGFFRSDVDFDPGNGFYQISTGTNPAAFVLKLDSDGEFKWANSFESTSYESGHSIFTDITGSVYTAGSFHLTVDFDPGPESFNLTSNGQADLFIQKMDSTGDFIWAAKYGGEFGDLRHRICLNREGHIYTTGFFYGSADFDIGPEEEILNAEGIVDGFVLKQKNCIIDKTLRIEDFTIIASEYADSYQWINCIDNEPILGATYQTFTPEVNKPYAAILTIGNCVDTTECIKVNQLSIGELQNSISIGPNPLKNELIIQSELDVQGVKIYNLQGQTVLSSNEKILNIARFNSGSYIVEIMTELGISQYKVVKYQ